MAAESVLPEKSHRMSELTHTEGKFGLRVLTNVPGKVHGFRVGVCVYVLSMRHT